MASKNQQLISVSSGLEQMISALQETKAFKVGNFYDFITDVWALGYESPELFKTWHVQLICEDVERAIADQKHYVCVLPRGHLKSTVLGYGFSLWRMLTQKDDSSILYLSYSHNMASYHISEINKYVRNNPVLQDVMQNRSPNADYSFRYSTGGKRVDIQPSGLFSFMRGMHLSGAMIADDILRDPENPLNLTQVNKVEEWFTKEAMYIPNQGVPIMVIGTPMMPDDLLTKLQNDERFISRVLPVFNPIPGKDVLAPQIRSEEWLIQERRNNPRAFSSEFMLMPYTLSNSYLNDEDLSKVENPELRSLDAYAEQILDSDYTVAGLDIGKKRHPSHLVIFTSKAGEMKVTQVNCTFLDGWDYSDQAHFINMVTKNFDIDKGYFDNTRSELEDRMLDSVWSPIRFTPKSKRQMAQIFEQYVVSRKVELINDQRQHGQIICVDNELKAPETPMGHGDAFFSVAMALMAHNDSTSGTTSTIGDMNDWIGSVENANVNKTVDFGGVYTSDTCPMCGESAGWIPSRALCLICYSDKMDAEDEALSLQNRAQQSEATSNFPSSSR